MPVLRFDKSADPIAKDVRAVCDAYGVELFAKAVPLGRREVLVRTKGLRGALGTVRLEDIEGLEKRLRSWGLRPLDEAHRDFLAREMKKLPPAETAHWDRAVLGIEPPDLEQEPTSAPAPGVAWFEDPRQRGYDQDIDELAKALENVPEWDDPPADPPAAERPPWEVAPPPEWWAQAITVPGETGAEQDGIVVLGYDAVDLGQIPRIGWEPRNESWRKEIPAEYVGILHLFGATLDVRMSIPSTQENAVQIAKAWTRINARRNMDTRPPEDPDAAYRAREAKRE